jgi:hypothetical protein
MEAEKIRKREENYVVFYGSDDNIAKSFRTQPRHPLGHPEGKGGRFAPEGEGEPHPDGLKDQTALDEKDKERLKAKEDPPPEDKSALVGQEHEQKKEMFSLQNEHAAAQQAQAAADEARKLHIHARGVNKFLDGVRKQDPSGGSVHVDVPLGTSGKKRRKKLMTDTVAKSDLFVPILKVDQEHRMVYGFATVSDKAGEPYFDNQGDHVSVNTIRKAWHDYVATPRLGGVNHERTDGGSLVEGLIIDDSVAEALSKALNKGYRGLFVGYHATDDKVWDGVKKGDFTGFSIAGKGKRRKVED